MLSGYSQSAKPDDADVKRELARVNKLHLQARSRLAELESRRAVQLNSNRWPKRSGNIAPYLQSPRSADVEQEREVLEVLLADSTLEKDGQLRILLVLPSNADSGFYTNVRRASACMFQDQGIELLASILQAA